jgi:predicted phage terminase large subunit-like protein
VSVDTERVLYAILRQNFRSFLRKVFHTVSPADRFIDGWPVKAIAYQLERVARGETQRLIINQPPRSLKSIAASVALPAFVLGHQPHRRIICVSYASDLARKMSNDFRAVLESDWYRAVFPSTRIGSVKDSESEMETTQRGFRLATSIGGTLTGRGGNLVIIDDPLKPIDALSETKRMAANQWFANTLLSRLDDKRSGAIVIVMQRVHLDDLTGFVLGGEDEWTCLSLPAIAESEEVIPLDFGRYYRRLPGEALWPEREPIEVLNKLRLQLGSDIFSAQYQQSPVPPGGAMIKRGWVMRYTEPPAPSSVWYTVQSWDTAIKGGPDNDWSVCTTWSLTENTCWYLVDVWRQRVNYPALKAKVQELAAQWRADQVLVEESGTAIGLIEELKFKIPGLTGIKPEHNKETRMALASAKFEAHQVYLPERASWLPELEAELFSFPGSKHDDQIDSISQAIQHNSSFSTWLKLARPG